MTRSNRNTEGEGDSISAEIQKLETTLKTALEAALEEQNKKVSEACHNNSLNVDKNAKSIAELNELILGLSVQLNKLVLDRNSEIPNSGQNNNIPRHMAQIDRSQPPNYMTRLAKIEFPKFDGTDLKPWLFRCRQFFDLENVTDENKVKLAALHMEGKALAWH